MAGALVSIALQKLTEVVEQQLSLFAGATHELKQLSSTLKSIQAVLADAESSRVEEEAVRLWLSRLRQVAYDIPDLLECVENDGSSNDDDDGDAGKCVCEWIGNVLSAPCTCLNWIVSRYELACSIKEIKQRLDDIADEKNKYGFNSSNQGGNGRQLVRSDRQTTGLIDESEMFIGRENDKETLISKLVSGSSHKDPRQVQVAAVVGIGGLGKTTIARQIYNDLRVRDHFNTALYWVCVSDVFDVVKLTKEILEQVKRKSTSLLGLYALQKELLEALEGKRFLLVLDDVWNDEAEKWNQLRLPLNAGAPGTRILVTTRSDKVANTMNATFIHELKGLSDADSWELFRSIAFAKRKVVEPLELEKVGRKIVEKCKGVPLSIKVTGSAMNTKSTAEDWKNVLESKIWSLRQATGKILPALLLTYCLLPAHLKQCFAYCSIFPKDWQLEKDRLVRLWVAQGFIQSDGNREKEDIGDEYFDELVARSMFQEVKENYEGKIICKMHDLLHDLAEFISMDEIYKSEGGKPEISPGSGSSNVRHAFLSDIGDYEPRKILIASGIAKKLRTLWLDRIDDGGIASVIDDLLYQARFLRALCLPSSTRLPESIGKLKHLRYLHLPCSKIAQLPDAIAKMKQLTVLDLHNSRIMKLPNAIGRLKQLRYLDLSGNSNIVELPESVSDLRNLHSLNLSGCVGLKKLPRGIAGMLSLRHLEIESAYGLELPKGLGRNIGLRSLPKFIVGDEGGCGVVELQGLNSLQGSLEIRHLERVSSKEEAEKAELWNKPHLRSLVLWMYSMERGRGDAESERMDGILEGLRPHANLKALKVYGSNISSKFPSWMTEKGSLLLPNLTHLEITGFMHCESMPGFGKLPALEYLDIRGTRVRKLGLEFYYGFSNPSTSNRSEVISAAAAATAFPKLEEFELRNMYELEEWALTTTASELADVIIMPSLRKVQLEDCPRLEGLPHHLTKTPLKHLSIVRCPRIKGIESFPFLEEFTLNQSGEFCSTGPLPRLPSLKQFCIRFMENATLPDEGWERMVALQKLEINCCRELKCLPDGLMQLHSLEDLLIALCDKLDSVPEGWGQLKKLKSLKIQELKALTCLPDSLGQLEFLEHLEIGSCEKLESLPQSFGHLKALYHLKIHKCKALESLPHGLQHLSLLRELEIYDCPLLSKRCEREAGEDWPKISHIPNIKIDGKGIIRR